jgi:hypothetical protein
MDDQITTQLRSLLSITDRMKKGLRMKDGEGRDTTDENLALFRQHAAGLITQLPDAALLAAYQRTDGQSGNSEADALAEELRRREIGH